MQQQQLCQLAAILICQSEITRLQRKFDAVVSDPLAFVPSEKRASITEEEATSANEDYGRFAADYWEQQIKPNNGGQKEVRLNSGKKAFIAGYGRGYDSKAIGASLNAGLEPWVIDVSPIACTWAFASAMKQAQELGTPVKTIWPNVKTAELKNALLEPSSLGLSLDDIEWWYLSRTLGCLSRRSSHVVLEIMGQSLSEDRDPLGLNGIVLINALRDCNCGVSCCSSKLLGKRMILNRITHGAGRPVEIRCEAEYRYFHKRVTAMTFRAR